MSTLLGGEGLISVHVAMILCVCVCATEENVFILNLQKSHHCFYELLTDTFEKLTKI